MLSLIITDRDEESKKVTGFPTEYYGEVKHLFPIRIAFKLIGKYPQDLVLEVICLSQSTFNCWTENVTVEESLYPFLY